MSRPAVSLCIIPRLVYQRLWTANGPERQWRRPIRTSSSASNRRDWNDLGHDDPYWGILSDPARRYGRWTLPEFMATGESELAAVMHVAAAHTLPANRHAAVDFGCGVGRVTRPMARQFETVHGLDISPSMLAQARKLNADLTNCTFEAGDAYAPLPFDDGSLDFVYCSRVLQHLKDRAAIRQCIVQLLRVVAPGGLLVFQLPTPLPPRHRAQPRRRAYAVLRSLRVRPALLHRSLGLSFIAMTGLPEAEVGALLRSHGGTLLEVRRSPVDDTDMQEGLYFVTKSPAPRGGAAAPAPRGGAADAPAAKARLSVPHEISTRSRPWRLAT